ncbi:MAG: hypothetical protein LBV40_03110 [Methanomicrobiales archaeon]|jgi:hypothetical protein|nr:hypothetical protein [Methanomicrobiales archaeon]
MSLLDNLKGLGGNASASSGVSTFNPFKLLSIGESLLLYTDGIRIKDYTFYAVLTSERFILVDNSSKGKGSIAKEMPYELIQKADLEHEGTTPVLILHVRIEGQVRHMRLLFTELIEKPEHEARAWCATINGYPLEAGTEVFDSAQSLEQAYAEETMPHIASPLSDADEDMGKQEDTPPIEAKPRQRKKQVVSPGIIDAEEEEERLVAAKILQSTPHKMEADAKQEHPLVSFPPHVSVQIEKKEVDPRLSVSIHVQKPKLTPLGRNFMNTQLPMVSGGGTSSVVFCVMCGTSIPAKSRFCRVCGERQ